MERSSYYRKALGRKVVCRILPGLLCFLPVLLPASGRSLVSEKGLVSGRVSASGQDVSFSLQDLGRGRYSYKGIRLRDGDLIFQEACHGTTEAAIKGVTRSAGGYAFTHVGMVCIREGKAYVLEANVPRVSLTPLEAFLMPGGVSFDAGADEMDATALQVGAFKNLIPKYNEADTETVTVLYAVDSAVSEDAAVKQVAKRLDSAICQLRIDDDNSNEEDGLVGGKPATPKLLEAADLGSVDATTLHYEYTGSVSVASKILTENHGMGMRIVAVQITRTAVA